MSNNNIKKDDFIKEIKTLVMYTSDDKKLGQNIRTAFEEFKFDEVFKVSRQYIVITQNKIYDHALTCAAKDGDIEFVKLLVQKGANVQAFGNWALRNAVRNKHKEIAVYLIEKGADIDNAIKYCDTHYGPRCGLSYVLKTYKDIK